MDILEIKDFLPHRYPFLLVDRVIEYTLGESMLALKNVSSNEPFFGGHFPHDPVMPGVLILEALAQVTGLLASKSALGKGVTYYLVSIDKARFKRRVVPGDQLMLSVNYLKHKRNFWSFSCCAEVEGQLSVSAEIKIMSVIGAP